MNNLKFINDKVVKKTLTSERHENREYLIRIISAITKIDAKLLRGNIELVTNEINSNQHTVNSTVDAIFKDNNEYINIEINYSNKRLVTIKNNIYLYNMILRQVDKSNNYEKVIPAIQININNYDTFLKNEFIYKTMMKENKYNIVRDEMIIVYDINLEYLRKIDYNKIKKRSNYNLEKLLYIFVCDNEELLDYLYEGDEIMEKVRDNFDTYIRELDEMLYYDPDKLLRDSMKEEIEEEVKKEVEKRVEKEVEKRVEKEVEKRVEKEVEKRVEKEVEKRIEKEKEKQVEETVKNMLKNNLDEEEIMKYLNLNKDTFTKIKNKL